MASSYWKRLMDRRLSRRRLLSASAVTAGAAAGLALAGCNNGDENNGAPAIATVSSEGQPPAAGAIEQQTQRRRGTGLIAWDRDRAFDGYTLFSPPFGEEGTVYLIDMSGKVVHTWSMALPAGLYSYILPNGNLLYLGHGTVGDAPPFVFKGGVISEVDWEGNTLWEFEHPDQHHDARLLPNGNLLLLCSEVTPAIVAQRVPGGLPVEGEDDRMWSDYILEVTREGETVWEWHAWSGLEPEARRMNEQDSRNEWTHGNSVEGLPNGDVLVSFRHINTVAIIDRRTREISWELGHEELAQQHAPTMLPNGNILIFDNGAHRIDNALPFSRVIEVAPETKEIVWEYNDAPPWNFFSPFISSAQRLPNGNTLITEGNFGRLFELTAEKEVVWEYISPFFVSGFLGDANMIFRAFRYSADQLPNLKT